MKKKIMAMLPCFGAIAAFGQAAGNNATFDTVVETTVTQLQGYGNTIFTNVGALLAVGLGLAALFIAIRWLIRAFRGR